MNSRWCALLFGMLLAPVTLHAAQPEAVVNGAAISEMEVARMLPHGSGQEPKARAAALDSLINLEVAAQAARKQQLDKSPEVQATITVATREILASAFFRRYLNDHPPTDSEIQAKYDEMLHTMPKEEYRLRHILVKTKDHAEKIAADLKGGASFDTLARESIDKATAEKGGEIGWIFPGALLPEIAAQMVKMKTGEVSEPIQSAAGWDVLQVEEKRNAVAPPLQQVQGSIRAKLQRERIEKYVAELRAKATVRIPPDAVAK
jgi:peptidyl-prolyl cis-trans isomerase C